MKVYKFKNRGIGWQVATVPTDSEYMIGIENPDGLPMASVKLYDGATEIPASFTLNDYVLFQTFSGGNPETKRLTAVLTGENSVKSIHIMLKIEKSSQSYIDSI